jgi:hypothetical protein
MYNIHKHYQNVWNFAKTICDDPRVAYLHPFGTTEPENLEILADDRPDLGPDDRGPLLLCYDQEPLISGFNERLFSHVMEFTNITDPDRIILLNTELESQEKNILLEKFKFREAYSFFHIFAVSDWYRGYEFDESLMPIEDRTITKKFITFNRLTGGARVYRSFLVSELAKRDLIEQGHISYSHDCPIYGHYRENILESISRYDILPDYAEETIRTLDKIKFPLRIDSTDDKYIPNGSMTLGSMKENMESFLHVVTETCFWDKKSHLTEKIFKPVMLQQPFVLVGCVNNLKYLKSYGFETFDKWWDESYDSIEDPIKRLQEVSEIVKYISSKSLEELKDMLLEMRDTLAHNNDLISSGRLLHHGWKELKENLTMAVTSVPK